MIRIFLMSSRRGTECVPAHAEKSHRKAVYSGPVTVSADRHCEENGSRRGVGGSKPRKIWRRLTPNPDRSRTAPPPIPSRTRIETPLPGANTVESGENSSSVGPEVGCSNCKIVTNCIFVSTAVAVCIIFRQIDSLPVCRCSGTRFRKHHHIQIFEWQESGTDGY